VWKFYAISNSNNSIEHIAKCSAPNNNILIYSFRNKKDFLTSLTLLANLHIEWSTEGFFFLSNTDLFYYLWLIHSIIIDDIDHYSTAGGEMTKAFSFYNIVCFAKNCKLCKYTFLLKKYGGIMICRNFYFKQYSSYLNDWIFSYIFIIYR